MSFGTAMYMRDTAFKFKQHGIDLTKNMLTNIASTKTNYNGAYQAPRDKNPWQIDNPYSNGKEDIRWLL